MPWISRRSQPSARGPVRPQAVAGGLSIAALLLVAACSSGGTSAGGGSGPVAVPPQNPRQALLAAATKSQQINSAVETLNIQGSGSQNETTTGTVRLRLKPTLLIGENLNLSSGGTATSLKAVVTTKAVYFSEPALSSQLGKPWIKLNLSSLGAAGAGLAQLFRSLQSDDFADQAQLLAASKNVRVVGHFTVDGVPTTEYAGSIEAAAAAKALPAAFRTALAPELKELGNGTISFQEWVDAQQHTRKITEVETANGTTLHITMNVTSLNQPVSVTLPPASQTLTVPASALSGAGTSTS